MQKDIEYLRASKKYVFIIAIIFILSLIAGLIFSVIYPERSKNLFDMFRMDTSWIKNLPPIGIMLVIFANNASKSFLSLVFGIGLGVIPILFVAANGVFIGMFANIMSKQNGTLFVIAALVPHGIIEVPMVLISAGIGLRLGYKIYPSLKGFKTDINKELREGIGFYVRFVLPLLFLAAIIETFVTPVIASLVTR